MCFAARVTDRHQRVSFRGSIAPVPVSKATKFPSLYILSIYNTENHDANAHETNYEGVLCIIKLPFDPVLQYHVI